MAKLKIDDPLCPYCGEPVTSMQRHLYELDGEEGFGHPMCREMNEEPVRRKPNLQRIYLGDGFSGVVRTDIPGAEIKLIGDPEATQGEWRTRIRNNRQGGKE